VAASPPSYCSRVLFAVEGKVRLNWIWMIVWFHYPAINVDESIVDKLEENIV
jgi:hypothetical protein